MLRKGPSWRHLWGKIFTKTLAQLIPAPPGQGPVQILMSHEPGGPCWDRYASTELSWLHCCLWRKNKDDGNPEFPVTLPRNSIAYLTFKRIMNCTVLTFLPQKEGAVSVQSDNPALNNKYNNKYTYYSTAVFFLLICFNIQYCLNYCITHHLHSFAGNSRFVNTWKPSFPLPTTSENLACTRAVTVPLHGHHAALTFGWQKYLPPGGAKSPRLLFGTYSWTCKSVRK